MYLSKITPSRNSIHKLKRSFDAELFQEHQMIWNLFDNTPDQTRDFLYRREDIPGSLPFYYVLSAREPVRNALDLDVQTKLFAPVFHEGDQLGFSLRANAVVTRKVDANSKNRKRRDIIEARVDDYKKQFPSPQDRPPPALIHHEAAEAWLAMQGQNHGFTVSDFLVENHVFHKVKKPNDNNTRRFASLDIRGQLIVNEPEKLVAVISTGLGRSKAFGCGLMLVRRVGHL